MNYFDLDKTAAYKRLMERAAAGKAFNFKELLTPERVKQCAVPLAEGLVFN
jgi:hypothetical protein